MNILFVCSANTCRSPMAEYYFRLLAALARREDITVSSAGINAFAGDMMSTAGIIALRKYGIDAMDFRSRRLTPYLLETSDLALTMTIDQLEYIRSIYPEYAAKCRLLMDYASGGEVRNPVGGTAEDYLSILHSMIPALENLLSSPANQKYSK